MYRLIIILRLLIFLRIIQSCLRHTMYYSNVWPKTTWASWPPWSRKCFSTYSRQSLRDSQPWVGTSTILQVKLFKKPWSWMSQKYGFSMDFFNFQIQWFVQDVAQLWTTLWLTSLSRLWWKVRKTKQLSFMFFSYTQQSVTKLWW